MCYSFFSFIYFFTASLQILDESILKKNKIKSWAIWSLHCKRLWIILEQKIDCNEQGKCGPGFIFKNQIYILCFGFVTCIRSLSPGPKPERLMAAPTETHKPEHYCTLNMTQDTLVMHTKSEVCCYSASDCATGLFNLPRERLCMHLERKQWEEMFDIYVRDPGLTLLKCLRLCEKRLIGTRLWHFPY